MNLLLTTVRGPLFSESQVARAVLLGTVCRQLRMNLLQSLVTPICTEALGHMMIYYRDVSEKSSDSLDLWRHDVENIALSTLGVLIQAVQLAQKTNTNAVSAS